MVNQIDAFAKVRDLIVAETGVRAHVITKDARLVEDLRIDGDDLAELMEVFFDRMQVDQRGFDADTYIPEEGLRLFGKKRQTRPLTVAMLMQSVWKGDWTTDEE